MNERKPSCELNIPVAPVEIDEATRKKLAARKGFENQPELIETAENMGITPAKLKSMREYAMILRKRDRRMKPSTIRKKILEKYKIKLV